MTDFCSHCGQKIQERYKITLSRNKIKFLLDFYKLLKDQKYVKTEDIYKGISYRGTNTGVLPHLAYLSALFHYPDPERSTLRRSGKWGITSWGILFLRGRCKLPSYVLVKNGEVIDRGELIFIDDKRLKWEKEEDIWKELYNFRSEGLEKEETK